MKNSFIQYGRWFILAFLLGVIWPYVNPDFFKADATNVYDSYDDLEDVLVAYHLRVNELTNTALEMLMNPDRIKLGYVEYPSDDAGCDTGKNASTYCLAVAINEELTQFEESLISRANEYNLETDFTEVTTLYTALNEATSQRDLIQEQIDTAEDALDLSLAVYNQIQIVYPLHIELTKFIENLEDYRDNLGDLRRTLSRYPSKFNGVTSMECK